MKGKYLCVPAAFSAVLIRGQRMTENTFEVVRQALAEQLRIDSATIKPESLIADDLGADSLDAVELILALEERYGISIEVDDAEGLKTVNNVVELLDRSKG
jgi:acyl carrier protein